MATLTYLLNLQTGKKKLLKTISEIIKAIKHLSENKSGSLICIEKIQLEQIINKGIKLDSIVSNEILISIFLTMKHLYTMELSLSVITRSFYAGSFLPLSNIESISKTFGTRHRAGLGISENSDAITIITSEETGSISLK